MKQKALLNVILFVILSLLFSCYWLWAADNSQILAIRAGKIWTVTNGVVTNGVIIVKNGKIDAIGENLSIPKNARVLDMPGKSVTPGLIDAHSHLGLSLDVLGEIEETVLPSTPDMQVLDAFNPLADDVKKALRSGVTTVLLSPGYRDPVAGQTAIVKLYGVKTGDWILKRSAGVKFSISSKALMNNRQPTSIPGLMTLIREELNKGRNYQGDEVNPHGEILRRVVEGKLPMYIYCDAIDEIANAIKITDEYKTRAILVGVREGDAVISMIAQRNIPVVYMPTLLLSRDKDLKRVGKIAGAGIKVAFASYAPMTDSGGLRTSAIIAMKYGLSPEVALKSLTINAAKILGVDQRVGSIEKDKDADLVILNGDPLELTSGIEMVIINGEIVYQ